MEGEREERKRREKKNIFQKMRVLGIDRKIGRGK